MILLLGCCFLLLSVAAADCALVPIAEQLQTAPLRTNNPEYNDPDAMENHYRKRLLRFINSYYSNIAEDLLRGEGEYLLSLHRLMGSASDTCTAAYKVLLVQEVNSQDFGMALWGLRSNNTHAATTAAQTWPAPDCVDCNIKEGKNN